MAMMVKRLESIEGCLYGRVLKISRRIFSNLLCVSKFADIPDSADFGSTWCLFKCVVYELSQEMLGYSKRKHQDSFDSNDLRILLFWIICTSAIDDGCQTRIMFQSAMISRKTETYANINYGKCN